MKTIFSQSSYCELWDPTGIHYFLPQFAVFCLFVLHERCISVFVILSIFFVGAPFTGKGDV